MQKYNFDKILYNVAFSVLAGVFLIFALSFLGFICRIPINVSYSIIGFVLMIFLNIFLLKKDGFTFKIIICSNIFLLLLILLFGILSQIFWDYSYDGRDYHQNGMIFFRFGYNPIIDSAQDFFNAVFDFKYKVPVWIECYPKFSEIVSANFFILTKKIEIGKTLNFLTSLIVFGYSYYIAGKYFNKKNKIIYASLFTINPVVISQIFTFCNDGLVYNFFTIALLSIIALKEDKSLKTHLILLMSLVCLVNIKLGGLIYSILLLLFALRYIKKPIFFSIVFLILFVLSGINPYFTNIKRGHNPLYPLVGSEKVDIMTHNTPKEFINKPMLFKFVFSIFAKTENYIKIKRNPIKLKIPFTVSKAEIYEQSLDSTRLSGFGALWSGIIILSLLGLFFIKSDKQKILLFLILSVLIIPHNWWARYVPQFYLVPVFIGLFINDNKKLLKFLIISFIILNSLLITYSVIKFQVLPFKKFSDKYIPIFDEKNFSPYDLEKFDEKGISARFYDN